MANIYDALRRDIEDALNPRGMSTHDGKVRTRCDLLLRLLKERDVLEADRDQWKARYNEAVQLLNEVRWSGRVTLPIAMRARIHEALKACEEDNRERQ